MPFALGNFPLYIEKCEKKIYNIMKVYFDKL
jgi:hypothetical protein